MDPEVLENHKEYLERKALFKSLGYDVDEERTFILEQAQPLSGKILEAGTGKGHFSLTLAKAGYSFISFDISSEEQHFARLNLEYFGLAGAVDLRIENAEATSFPAASFDVIFSVNVLHHLRNAGLVLDELLRLLSANGKLVLADFTEEGFRLMDKIHGLEGNTHSSGQMPQAKAEDYLKEKGFVVQTSQSVYQWVLTARRKTE